jgi:hypothetical protein
MALYRERLVGVDNQLSFEAYQKHALRNFGTVIHTAQKCGFLRRRLTAAEGGSVVRQHFCWHTVPLE